MTDKFGTHASRNVIRRLEDAGYEAVFVGGAVRDRVLGKEASDIDIATSAMPGEVKNVFGQTVDIGIEHGTVLVLSEGEPIEVTTYRTEGTYTDHRRPDQVEFVRSLTEDLRRRDFTMNAMAITLAGDLIDPFGGMDDLQNRQIRAVGNPARRFGEDALRMFRAIRFSSVLGFDVEHETLSAIRTLAGEIRFVAVERLKAEWDKLLAGKDPWRAFRYIEETGIGVYLPCYPKQLPPECRDCGAPFADAPTGWAFLMIAGNLDYSKLAGGYKMSNREKQWLKAVSGAYSARKEGFQAMDYYLFETGVLLAAERIHRCVEQGTEEIPIEEIKARKARLPISSKRELAMTGSDLLKWAGIRGGSWTKEWLERIERAVVLGHCPNSKEAIKEWFLNEFKLER